MKKLIYILFFYWSISLVGQTDNFPKGIIIDSVFVSKNLKESYSLYIPKNYDSTMPSPVILIFEPMARGKLGVSRFLKAAEKYNYILVCSNNSKNATYQENFEIVNRLFAKVFSDFELDPNRIYTAGLSGGARLASTIAVLTGKIQGVIACGAGFSTVKSHLPRKKTNFSYATIIGDEDMNYREMYNTKNFLNSLNISNELFVYEFGHEWPNEDQILRAVDWLQLEAYRKKLIKTDTGIISDIYINYNLSAIELAKNNQLLKASYELERVIKNFNSSFILDSIAANLIKIKKTKLYNKKNKNLVLNFKKEVNLSNKFIKKFSTDFIKKTTNIKWWENEIGKLKKKIINSNSIDEKKMLKRLEYKIFAFSFETASLGNKVSNINQSIFCYDICLLIYPKNHSLYFRQAKNYIKKNDTSQALNYLEKLLNNGYNDTNTIINSKTFKSLKNNPRFIELTKN